MCARHAGTLMSCIHICLGMCIERTRIDLLKGVYISVYMDVYIDMLIDLHIDVYMDVYIDMLIDLHID